MTFRYLAIPNYSSVLGVNVEVADGSKELAWLNTGYSIQQWVEQQVQLNFTRKSYTGLTIVSDLENLWLNRVRFSSGLCPSTNPCTFDQATFCEWNDVSTDLRYKFETIRKEESLHRQFPRSDARFNIHSGRYLALNHQLDAKTTEDTITMQTKQAVLVGPVLDVGKTHSYCLRFKLWRPQKYGPNLKVVLVGLIDDEIKATYWNLNKIPYKMMNEWQQMEVAVLRPMAGRIGIAVSQSFISDSNALALDDLELLPGNCVPAVDCPFNVSLCGYYPANFQSLPFTLGDGSLEDEDSLANRLGRPCVYANFPTPVDSKLEIYIFEMKSQWRTPNRYVNANCLQFEFVVLSESKDSSSISESINSTVRLRIGIENAQNQYTLFEYEATNSNGWQKVEVSIQESNTFRVQVLAERVSGHRRAVIGLANMKAPIFGCKKKIIQSNKDPKRIDSLSCDFAVDLCGWKQRHAGQWRIQTRHETNQGQSLLNFLN